MENKTDRSGKTRLGYKKVLLWTAAVLLILSAVGIGLFFALGMPERIVERILRSLAAEQGLEQFNLTQVELHPSGEFSLQQLSASGVIDAASEQISQVELTFDQVSGNIRWSKLLKQLLGFTAERQPQQPPAHYAPEFLANLQLQQGIITLELKDGSQLRLEGLMAQATRPRLDRLELSVALDSLQSGTDILHARLTDLMMDLATTDRALKVNTLQGQTIWGQVNVRGMIENVYTLADEISHSVEILQSVESVSSESVLDAFQAWEKSRGQIEIEFSRKSIESPYVPVEGVEIVLPREGFLLLEATPAGLVLEATASSGTVTVQEWKFHWENIPLHFSAPHFSLRPAPVSLESAPLLGLPPIPILLEGEIDFGKPDAPLQLSAHTTSAQDAGVLLQALRYSGEPTSQEQEDALTLEGETSASLVVQGHLIPAAIESARAVLDLNLSVQIRPETPALPLRGKIVGTLAGNRLQVVSEELESVGGQVQFDFRGQILEGALKQVEGKYALQSVSAELLLAQIFPVAATGVLSLSGKLDAPEGWTGDFETLAHLDVRLDELTIEDTQSTGEMELSARLVGNSTGLALEDIRLEAFGGLAQGKVYWQAPVDYRSATVDLALNVPDIQSLHSFVPELTFAQSGSLEGSLRGEGSLAPGGEGVLRLHLVGKDIQLDEQVKTNATIQGLVTPDGFVLEGIRIHSKESHLELQGRLDFDGTMQLDYQAQIRRDWMNPYQAFQQDASDIVRDFSFDEKSDIRLKGQVSGTLQQPEGWVQMALNDISFRDILIGEAQAQAHYKTGSLHIETLEVSARQIAQEVETTGEISRLRGNARVDWQEPLQVEFLASFDPLDLALLDSLLPEGVELSGMATAELSGRYANHLESFRLQWQSSQLSLREEPWQDVAGEIQLDEGQVQLQAAASPSAGGSLRLKGEGASAALMEIQLDVENIPLSGLPRVPESLSGQLKGALHVSIPEWEGVLQDWKMEHLIESLSGSATLELASATWNEVTLGDWSARGVLEKGVAQVELHCASPSARGELTANLPAGEVRLQSSWEEVDLRALARGALDSVQVAHSGSCDLRWSPESPLQGWVQSRDTRIVLSEYQLAQERPALIVFEEDHLRVEDYVLISPTLEGPALMVAGVIPLATDRPDLGLDFTLKDMCLAIFEGVWAGIRDLEGQLQGSGRLTGSLSDPSLIGRLTVSRGRFRTDMMPQGLSDIELVLSGDRDGFRLERFEGRMGRGIVSASGEILLTARQLPRGDIRLAFRDVRYTAVRDLTVEMNGNLRFGGDPLFSRITGDVIITRGAYTRPFDWTRIVLARFGAQPVGRVRESPWNPQLDINIQMPGNFWIRNSIINAEMGAEGRLVGTLDTPTFTGRAFALRGVFQANFARFRILRAIGLFEETRPFIPYLLISGEARERGYLIRGEISGEPESLEIRMSSSPPLSEEQIVRLLTTGSIERGAGGESASAAWILSQGLQHSAGTTLSRALPVDSVELRPAGTDDEQRTELVTEQRLGQRFSLKQYFGLEDPGSTALGADYQLTERVLLSGRAKEGNIYVLEVIYEILF